MSDASYSCPYCCADIPAQAIACRHCGHDLALFRPLALQLQALQVSLAQINERLVRQQQALDQLQAGPGSHPMTAPGFGSPAQTGQAPSWGVWLGMAGLTFALLGLSHWVLLFLYDAPPMALRVLTIVLPMLTGYLAARWSRLPLPVQLLSATAVGIAAVILMLSITARIDGVPLWPGNPREWRETLEYTAAIVLGSFTGALVHHLLEHLARRNAQKLRLSVLLERDANGHLRIADISNQVQSLVSALAPLVSAGTALYSGLKIFIGD